MSGLRFRRPVGANADVKELEYVIALHQTSDETRKNATVSSRDILAVLRSRYNLKITHNEALGIVRSLGGGDTVADDPPPSPINIASNITSNISATTQKSKDFVGGAIHKALGGLQNPFAKHNHGEGEVAGEDEDGGGNEDGNLAPNTEKTSHFGEKISVTTSNMLLKLHHMHGKHQQGEGDIDDHAIHKLKEDIVADLRAQVMKKTKQGQITPEEDSCGSSTGTMEIEFVSSNHAKSEYTPAEEFQISQVATASGASLSFNGKEAKDEEVADDGSEKLAEYLDTVQILSTLLSAKFAQIAHKIQNTHHEKEKKNQHSTVEEPSVLAPDEEDSSGPPNKPRLATRLLNRFINYGRRKLQINDEEADPFMPHDVIDLGLEALLKNLLPVEEHELPVLDETLVRLLLLCHGEVERAYDEELIHDMVAAANSSSGLFNQEALANAISLDLLVSYDPACLDHDTSFFFDVFGVARPSMDTKLRADRKRMPQDIENGRSATQELSPTPANTDDSAHESAVDPVFVKCCDALCPILSRIARRQYTFSIAFLGIDMVVDTTASIVAHILIWVTYILTAIVYGGILIEAPSIRDECSSSNDYWCKIADTVYSWLIIALLLIALGLYFVLPTSIGNNPSDQTPRRQSFACFWVLLNSVTPFFVVAYIDTSDINNSGVKAHIEGTVFNTLQIMTLCFALVLAFLFFLQALTLLLVSTDHPHLLPRPTQSLLALASWNAEVRIYQAAKYKLGKILSNALKLHGVGLEAETINALEKNPNISISKKLAFNATADRTSRNFVLYGETEEEVGGLFWTFWRLCDGHLFKKEGLWLNTRLLVIQVAQVAIAGSLVILMFVFAKQAADAADEYIANLDPWLPSWVVDIFPTGAMIESALIPATFISCFFMFFLIIIYIPSSFATILKYRGKIYPSLGSEKFQRFRSNVDLTYMNTGNAIYGMLGAGLLFYFAVGLTIMLFLWPYTQYFMQMLVAWGIGLAITVGIKMLVTQAFRQIQYRSYYRIHPASARVTSLALECWHIGLAGSVLVARVTQFLLAALFWVGRIDTQFLGDDVVAFGYGFDMVPTHYHKDLLVHEAHRHPYIEQLCQMYLMKLRYGDKFISNAGAAWRQLLILALFPWLTKRRVFRNERRIHARHEADEVEEKEEKENDPYGGVKEMRDNVAGVKQTVGEEAYEVGQELYGAGEDIVSEGVNLVNQGTRAAAKRRRSWNWNRKQKSTRRGGGLNEASDPAETIKELSFQL